MNRIAKAVCGCTSFAITVITDSSTCSYLDQLIDAKGDRSKS